MWTDRMYGIGTRLERIVKYNKRKSWAWITWNDKSGISNYCVTDKLVNKWVNDVGAIG